MSANPTYLPTIIFGSKMPEIRLRSKGGMQVYFCRKNQNLHLSDEDFTNGTYEAGRFLSRLCELHCRPRRSASAPCPAFADSYKVFTKDESLASVEVGHTLSSCLGVQHLLSLTDTPEETFFLRTYLDQRAFDEFRWREAIGKDWNRHCSSVDDDIFETRRAKFDRMMWGTVRFPALIPQVWLNWLYASSEEDLRALEDNASRVDFVAYYRGERHLVEIDGPSHYATYDERTNTYAVDERAYARNLRATRNLEKDGWRLTRIARVEVREAMLRDNEDETDYEPFSRASNLAAILPFTDRRAYGPHPSCVELGVGELEAAIVNDDIPF